MLLPKRTKYRKQQRGRMKGKASRGNFVAYGAARVAINRYIKRGGKVWIKIFPDKPVSKKPAQVRMGSGKAANEYWCAVVKPGRVLFEVAGVPEADAREALRLAGNKLPCKVKIVAREKKEEEA